MSSKSTKIAAILASLFCFAAGISMLIAVIIEWKFTDYATIGFGLYFIGKGFFVGPMLIATINKSDNSSTK